MTYNAEITFPSGFWFTVRIYSLSTACYWARVFGCNVLVFAFVEEGLNHDDWTARNC